MDKSLKIALILSATDRASAVLGRAFSNAERHAKALERSAKGFNEIGNKTAIAGGVVTAFFAKTVADARESQIEQNKLTEGFKTMGYAAEQAQKAVDFAGQQQFILGVEDEQIMAVQGKLGTFARTMSDVAQKNDIFNRATAAAFDMQAKNFGDALSNANQLGKALQNPALGATALAKSGTINKEDLPGIKFLQKTKGVAAAQLFLMQAIEKQVKGTAAQTADGVKVLELELKETSEGIGRSLLPEVNKLAKSFANYVPKIIDWVEKHKGMIVTIAKIGVSLLVFGGAMKFIALTLSGLSTAFQVAGLAAKGLGLMLSLGSREAILSMKSFEAIKFAAFAIRYHLQFSVMPALKKAGTAFVEFGATLLANPITWYIAAAVALGAAVYFIVKNWSKVSAFFSKLWSGVKQVFAGFWNWAKTFLLGFTPAGLVIKHWARLAGMFNNVWASVKGVFTGAWQWITNLGAKFYDAGKNIVGSIWRGIKTMAMKPVEAIKSMVTKIRKFLPFSPAKEGPLKDIHRIKLVETIAQSLNARPLLAAWNNVTGQLFGQMNRPVASMAGAGGQAPVQFHLHITLSGGATNHDATNLFEGLKPKLDRWWKEKSHQADRTGF